MSGERKHFLDWLRAGAFGVLILFHIGLLYATWDYNIKSERIYPGLDVLLLTLSPWRLVLLFFISGVASRFLLDKLEPHGFTFDRLRRLLVVLLLGMLVINPVQVYVEFLHKGIIEPGYPDFWLETYLRGATFPGRILPTWDHLWFLLYLLFYSFVLAAVFAVVRSREMPEIPLVALVAVPGLWLCLTNVLIQEFSPVTMAFFDDWGNHLRWAGVFAAGVVSARRTAFWSWLDASRRPLLALSIAGLALQLVFSVYARRDAIDPAWYGTLYGVIGGLCGWAIVLTLIAYGARYLNRDSMGLRYLTDAVLPVYVMHQPIMLVAAWALFPLALPLPAEGAALVLITGIGSLAFYELAVRRWRISRFLFGLRLNGRPSYP